MKRTCWAVLLGLGASISAFGAEHTRVTYPSAVGIEVLGRASMWSVFFDQVVSDDLVVGAGLGTAPLQDYAGTDLNRSVTLLPVYGNYYFTREAGSVYGTAGFSIALNGGSVRNTEVRPSNVRMGTQSIIPTVGIGYENRTDRGFVFRIAGYGLIADNFRPWVGVSFGYSAF